MTKVTNTPYAVVFPITMQARITVNPKDIIIALIGLGEPLARTEHFARSSVGQI